MEFDPKIKPRLWNLKVGDIAYNCKKASMPHPVLATPMWTGAGSRIIDYSGKGNHGTLTNGAKWVPKGVGFDGTDDSITGTFTGLSNFVATVSCWIYPHTEGEHGRGRIIIFYPSSGWNVLFFDVGGTNRLEVSINDGVNTIGRVGTNNDITLNAWNHVVYSYDGSAGGTGIKIYVNGSEVTYTSTTGANAVSAVVTSFVIGANSAAGEFAFDGVIYDAVVFDTVLTPHQAKFLCYNPDFMYQQPEMLYVHEVVQKLIETKYDIYAQKIIEGEYDIHLQKLLEGEYDIHLQKLLEGEYDIYLQKSISVVYDILLQKIGQVQYDILLNKTIEAKNDILLQRSVEAKYDIHLQKIIDSIYDIYAKKDIEALYNIVFFAEVRKIYKVLERTKNFIIIK